jgi:hypothetical protein
MKAYRVGIIILILTIVATGVIYGLLLYDKHTTKPNMEGERCNYVYGARDWICSTDVGYGSLEKYDIITLTRFACDGNCPVYDISIYRDGSVIYEGIEDVKIEGRKESKISSRELQALIDAFKEAEYFNLSDNTKMRSGCYTDASSARTTFTYEGKTKAITNYHGCPDYDMGLSELENLIDETVNSSQWVE